MTRYGIPMQGGKSKLADWIIDLFPKATHFYDLFGGGCSVAHAALLSGKFEHVHANDITDSVKLFEDALNGDLDKYEPERFRTREDFFAEKGTNPFVRIVYSFGNDQYTYLYSKEIEPYKKAVHEMLYAPTVNERRLKFKAVIREMAKLGLIEYKSGDRRYDCESQERIDTITSSQPDANTPPPNIDGLSTHRSVKSDWLGHYERLQTEERAVRTNKTDKTMRLKDLEHYERIRAIAAHRGCGTYKIGGGIML